MADKKKDAPPTNYDDLVSNQETSIRDAKVPDEKPDESTIAQVEEIKGE
jgi:hypothetical protein